MQPIHLVISFSLRRSFPTSRNGCHFRSSRWVNGAQIPGRCVNQASSPELPTMKTPTSHLSPIERCARRSRFRRRAIERGLPGLSHVTAQPLPMLGSVSSYSGDPPQCTSSLAVCGLRPPLAVCNHDQTLGGGAAYGRPWYVFPSARFGRPPRAVDLCVRVRCSSQIPVSVNSPLLIYFLIRWGPAGRRSDGGHRSLHVQPTSASSVLLRKGHHLQRV
jgi:hypothetical protein